MAVLSGTLSYSLKLEVYFLLFSSVVEFSDICKNERVSYQVLPFPLERKNPVL